MPTEDLAASAPLATNWLIPPDLSQDPPLAAPAGMAVDVARQRLFVLELQPPEIRVYSSVDGRFLGRWGREGDGPGELRAPMSLAVSPDGTVAVVTIDGRVAFWSSEGAPADGVRLGGAGLATHIVAIGADGFAVKIDRFPPADVSEFHTVGLTGGSAGVRFSDGGITELSSGAGRPRNHAYAVAGSSNGELLISPPGREYIILRVSNSGSVVQRIRRPDLPPLLRDASEIAEIRAKVRDGFTAAGRRAPDRLDVTTHRPHVTALAVAPDGEIFGLTGRGDAESTVVDRFDREGRFLASYVLPVRAAELAVTAADIYVLGLDSTNLPGIAVTRRPDRSSAAAAR